MSPQDLCRVLYAGCTAVMGAAKSLAVTLPTAVARLFQQPLVPLLKFLTRHATLLAEPRAILQVEAQAGEVFTLPQHPPALVPFSNSGEASLSAGSSSQCSSTESATAQAALAHPFPFSSSQSPQDTAFSDAGGADTAAVALPDVLPASALPSSSGSSLAHSSDRCDIAQPADAAPLAVSDSPCSTKPPAALVQVELLQRDRPSLFLDSAAQSLASLVTAVEPFAAAPLVLVPALSGDPPAAWDVTAPISLRFAPTSPMVPPIRDAALPPPVASAASTAAAALDSTILSSRVVSLSSLLVAEYSQNHGELILLSAPLLFCPLEMTLSRVVFWHGFCSPFVLHAAGSVLAPPTWLPTVRPPPEPPPRVLTRFSGLGLRFIVPCFDFCSSGFLAHRLLLLARVPPHHYQLLRVPQLRSWGGDNNGVRHVMSPDTICYDSCRDT